MQYDFQLQAGGGQSIEATGIFIKYKSGLGAIRVTTSNGDYIDLTVGQGIRVSKQFSRIVVNDKSGSINTGVLVVGDVDFHDDSIVGTVQVVDGGKNNTLKGNCFLGAMNPTIATAGHYGFAYLTNPSNSGKTIIFEALSVWTSVGEQWSLHMVPTGNTPTTAYGTNKLVNGPQSTGILWTFEESSLAGPGTILRKEQLSAGVSRDFKPTEPIILLPGNTIGIGFGTVVGGGWVNLEWREDPL